MKLKLNYAAITRYFIGLTCTVLFGFAMNKLQALDVYVPNYGESRQKLRLPAMSTLLEHGQILIANESNAGRASLNQLLNMKIIESAQQLHVHLGEDSQNWYLQSRGQNVAQQQAWWQEQLEQMQCKVPGIGIEHSGMRFAQSEHGIILMGRNVFAIPETRAIPDNPADITVAGKEKNVSVQFYLHDTGVNMRASLPYAEQETTYVDKQFLSGLPQEIYAWQIIMVNAHTRGWLIKEMQQFYPILGAYKSQLPEQDLIRFLQNYYGEFFFGISNGRSGIDVSFALQKNSASEDVVSGILSESIDAGQRKLFCVPSESRWVLSSSKLMAETVSGTRKIHFPQILPESIVKQQNLVIAARANTLAMAQKYYELLPFIKRYSDHIENDTMQALKDTLIKMIPHLKEAIVIGVQHDHMLQITGNDIGSAGVIGLGLSMCHPDTSDQTRKGSDFVEAMFERVSSALERCNEWPVSLKEDGEQRNQYCYLKPEDEFDYDIPVIIENPARHAGQGSYVVFSNGETRFISGRAIWNRAKQLQAEGGHSSWEDWRSQHEAFTMIQNTGERIRDERLELQALLEQAQQDD